MCFLQEAERELPLPFLAAVPFCRTFSESRALAQYFYFARFSPPI